MPDEGLKNNPQNTERLNIKPFSTGFVKEQIDPKAPQIETHTVKDFEQAVTTYLYENSKNFKTLINFKYNPEGADVFVEVFYKNKKGTRASVEISAAEVFEQSLGRKVARVGMLGDNFLITFKEETPETTTELAQSAKEKETEVIVDEEIPEPEAGITGSGGSQMRPEEFEDFVANEQTETPQEVPADANTTEKKKSEKEMKLEKLLAQEAEINARREKLLQMLEEIERNKQK